jgi:hypothetical protein
MRPHSAREGPRKRKAPPVQDAAPLENSSRTEICGPPSVVNSCVDLGDARFQRDVERLHQRGARTLFEMLTALGAATLLRTEIEAVVRRYAAVDAEVLAATGGDRFPAIPLHAIGGRR